jgi:hypothetical protein
VGSVLTQLDKMGFRCARVSASGQRKGSRRQERGLDGDVIALADPETGYPHLIIEVGGPKKSVAESLAQMTEHPLPPGFVPLVARCIGRGAKSWRWHFVAHKRGHDSLPEVLSALREVA